MAEIYDCIIIGAGASGLMLAAAAELEPTEGNKGSAPRGLILERTNQPGAKLLRSGGGRCNITHGGSIKDFINAYGEAGLRLRKNLYRHNNIELASWLEDAGIVLADEHGEPVYSYDLENAGRVFPASMKASDVLELLLDRAHANGWQLRTESEVYGIRRLEETADAPACFDLLVSPAEHLQARSVVLATGGITFPETGSDGSGFGMMREMGINIVTPRSALAPVYVRDYPYEELSGISLSGVTVTAFSSDAATTCKGKAARMTGDLLFTHRGFSGPVMLNISRYAEPGEIIRLSYGRDVSELPRRMQRVLEARAAGPSGDVRTTELARLLDRDDFVIESVDENGMVTAGGVSLDEIDMSTMKISRLSYQDASLYAIGEAIDADGITGGYNLQMCWSTARTAADSLAKDLNA